jgi:hypothetical protein
MRLFLVFAFAGLLTPWALRSQERKDVPEPSFYKVEIHISDAADASSKAGRRYTILVDSARSSVMRVGNRVPYVTATIPTTQYQYLEEGLNLDCRIRESSGKVVLSVDLDLSTPSVFGKTDGASAPTPTIATTRMNVSGVVVPGKATQIAAIDDPASKRKLTIEALVTKLN